MEHVRSFPIDRRPLYPEVLAFGAPRGTRTRLKAAASAAGLPVSELIRRAIAQALALPSADRPRAGVEA